MNEEIGKEMEEERRKKERKKGSREDVGKEREKLEVGQKSKG